MSQRWKIHAKNYDLTVRPHLGKIVETMNKLYGWDEELVLDVMKNMCRTSYSNSKWKRPPTAEEDAECLRKELERKRRRMAGEKIVAGGSIPATLTSPSPSPAIPVQPDAEQLLSCPDPAVGAYGVHELQAIRDWNEQHHVEPQARAILPPPSHLSLPLTNLIQNVEEPSEEQQPIISTTYAPISATDVLFILDSTLKITLVFPDHSRVWFAISSGFTMLTTVIAAFLGNTADVVATSLVYSLCGYRWAPLGNDSDYLVMVRKAGANGAIMLSLFVTSSEEVGMEWGAQEGFRVEGSGTLFALFEAGVRAAE